MEANVENTTASKICRACLSRDEPFMKLFDMNYSSLTDEKLSLCEMLASVAYLEVHLGDGLPDVICQSCAEKVNVAHNFRTLCKRSDAYLRETAMDSGHYFETEESHIHLVKTENIKKEETDCLEASLSTKSGAGVLPNNAFTSTGPKMIHSYTFTQELNPMDTGQSICQNLIEKIKKEPVSDHGIERNMCNSAKLLNPITDQSVCQDEEINKKPPSYLKMNKLEKKLSKEKNIKCANSEPSNSFETEERSDDSNEQGHLESDLARSAEPEIFTCTICSQTFIQRMDLLSHKRTHPPGMRHHCPHCPKTFSRNYHLQQHITTHSDDKAHKCTICGKGYHLSVRLKQHMKSHQGIKPHACQICDKRFHALYTVKEHMRYAHSDDRYTAACDLCDKKFTTKYSLANHMTIHSGERPHVCKECGKGFSLKRNLKNHMQTHTDRPPEQLVVCEYEDCGKVLCSKASLQVHIKHMHSTERPFACEFCTKAFPSKQGLNEHQSVHTGEKPEVCSICGSKFVSKESLKKHMRLHTGERPYSCPHCDQTFVSSSRVTDHIKSKHMERTEECPDCGKKFHIKSTLVKHMRLHAEGKRPKGKQTASPVTVEVQQINSEPSSDIV